MIYKFLLLSLLAFAYIPSSQFIFERVSALHGKGTYKINMDLKFSSEAETQFIKESWIVVDGGEMYFQATGDGFRTVRLFKRGRVFWVDQDSAERSTEVPSEFFMSYLTTRNSNDLKKVLNKNGYLPAGALKDRRIPKEQKDIKLDPEEFVHLGRNNGSVHYIYGSSVDGPGVWIQQDYFYITKLRSPQGGVFLGQDFAVFSKNLAFPKNQTYVFNDGSSDVQVALHVTNVSSIDLSAEQKKLFEPSWIRTKSQDTITVWPKNKLTGIIQTFYKRFR